jgi:hypothetical protein
VRGRPAANAFKAATLDRSVTPPSFYSSQTGNGLADHRRRFETSWERISDRSCFDLGVRLTVYGGLAVSLYTAGAYISGDVYSSATSASIGAS